MTRTEKINAIIFYDREVLGCGKFNRFLFGLLKMPKRPIFYYNPLFILSFIILGIGFDFKYSDMLISLILVYLACLIFIFALNMRSTYYYVFRIAKKCIKTEDKMRTEGSLDFFNPTFRYTILNNVLDNDDTNKNFRNISLMTISFIILVTIFELSIVMGV